MIRKIILRITHHALRFTLLLAACTAAPEPPNVLRLATTTSTFDSGLLDAILPDFEAKFGARVDVVAVGTGQALALGRASDADVLLVHAPEQEQQFVADGYGSARFPVMYNDFVIVGPLADPAGISGLSRAAEALTAIAATESLWASRGDQSGTHFKERELWAQAGFSTEPAGAWYNSLGQGMGGTLRFAEEKGAYTLSDRGTYLSQRRTFSDLVIHVGGSAVTDNSDSSLYNQYSVIPVTPNDGAPKNRALAMSFVEWLTAAGTQAMIADFGLDKFGQTLFFPNAGAQNAANPAVN